MAHNICVLESFCGKEKACALIDYLKEILKINEYINLTSITNFQDACLLHIEDSLTALEEVNNAVSGPILDMGCGGGFPGVVLGVASERETTLVDSKAKKIKAVKNAIISSNVCKFSKFNCVSERIEDFEKSTKNKFAVVTARALSSLPTLLELAAPLLKENGVFVALKGTVDTSEEKWGDSLSLELGLELINKRSFVLSDNLTKRTIYNFCKVGESKHKLPRKVGLAQKKPLVPSQL